MCVCAHSDHSIHQLLYTCSVVWLADGSSRHAIEKEKKELTIRTVRHTFSLSLFFYFEKERTRAREQNINGDSIHKCVGEERRRRTSREEEAVEMEKLKSGKRLYLHT